MSDTKDFRLVASAGSARSPHEFNKMNIDGTTFRDDVTMRISAFDNSQYRRIKKPDVMRALEHSDAKELRAISNYFFLKSGIYSRLCRYMAYLFYHKYYNCQP